MKLIRTSTVPQSLNRLLKGQLKFLNKHFSVVALSGYDKNLEEVKNREGVEIKNIVMSRKIDLLQDILSLIKLFIYFKKVKPTIVHSITPKAGLLTMLAGKMAGVPIRMHTFTGLIFPTQSGKMQKLLIWMDKLLCWASTNIYPEGQGVKSDLVDYQITSKPLKVLANGNVNGIDLQYYNIDNVSLSDQKILKCKLDISENDFVFVFVGRLVGDKGINELVEAFSKLKLNNSKLLLVGPLETDLDPLKKNTLEEIDRNDNIISVGFQVDVRPFFAISNALVFPSYREGFPNVVMQAGAMQLPSIVTNINGCNEIIIEGKNGTIIPVKNSDSILKAMENFMENRSYYNNLKSNAQPMIKSRYEQNVVWNALLEEYNLLVNKLAN